MGSFWHPTEGTLSSHGGNSYKDILPNFGAEHESDLVFQAGSIDWVCSAWPPGRWSSARASSIGAYNGGASAARSCKCGEGHESGARAAAHNHTWRLEI